MFKSSVAVFGAVHNPGYFETSDNISIEELINQCGGLLPDANKNLLTVFRRPRVGLDGKINLNRFPILKPVDQENGSLMIVPGDSVYVPVKVGFVKISGKIGQVAQIEP